MCNANECKVDSAPVHKQLPIQSISLLGEEDRNLLNVASSTSADNSSIDPEPEQVHFSLIVIAESW